MSRLGLLLLLIVAAAVGAGGGYWYASRQAAMPSASLSAEQAAAADRPILYYRDPSGAPFWSAEPKKDAQGRDYLPVYGDEEQSSAPQPKKPPVAGGERKIRFYRNPMGLPDTSPVPKKDTMGMDYIPVYEDEDQGDDNTIKVSVDRVQRSGVRTEKVQLRTLTRPVRAPGTVRIDERKQLEYALAIKASRNPHDASQMAMVDGAAQKLRSLGVPEARIREIQQGGTVSRTIEWPAPASGTVLEKKVISGQRIMAGDELYRIADLSTVWVIAEVPERDIGSIASGDRATVTFRAFSSQPMEGRVTLVYPELKAETRTARVRIELPNLDGRLKPDMYADVVFHADAEDKPVVAVPDSAVIDSGTRQLVLISKGEGRFEPRVIKMGRHGDGYVEALEGIKEGEEVVTTATFLIDAESNLRAALKGFTPQEPPK